MAGEKTILTRYAKALHSLAGEAGIHEQVEAELADLDRMLADNEALRSALGNPRRTRAEKKRVLLDILGEGVTALLRSTVLLMADKGRAGLLPGLGWAYTDVAMAAAGREVARVETAIPLDEASRSRLKDQLERLTGRSISIEERVDESLLGGLRVVVGSQMIDGSLRRRLENLKDTMLRTPLAGARG